MKHYPILINGDEISTSEQLVVRNPFDGSEVGFTFLCGEQELERAIQAGLSSQRAMAALS
jgi:hypothetical protein